MASSQQHTLSFVVAPGTSDFDIVFVHDIHDGFWSPDREEGPRSEAAVSWRNADIRSCRAVYAEYSRPKLSSLCAWTSETTIKTLSSQLVGSLNTETGFPTREGKLILPSKHIILVGHGYGGLICEQTLVILSTIPEHATTKSRVQGTILLGTPHGAAGLSQWSQLVAERMRSKISNDNDLELYCSKCQPGFEDIYKIQQKLRQILSHNAGGIWVCCCYGEPQEPTPELFMAPEWCVLPAPSVRPFSLDCEHDKMTMKAELVRPVHRPGSEAWKTVQDLIEAIVESAMNGHQMVLAAPALPTRKELIEASRPNDPAVRFDNELAGHYAILPDESSEMKVHIGDIIESPSGFQKIISFHAIRSAMGEGFQKSWLQPSLLVRNVRAPWKNVLPNANWSKEFPYILRAEWSHDRAVEYIRAVFQFEKAVRNRLLDERGSCYLVIGILQGTFHEDQEFLQTALPLGYRLLKVEISPTDQAVRLPRVDHPTTRSKKSAAPPTTKKKLQFTLSNVDAKIYLSEVSKAASYAGSPFAPRPVDTKRNLERKSIQSLQKIPSRTSTRPSSPHYTHSPHRDSSLGPLGSTLPTSSNVINKTPRKRKRDKLAKVTSVFSRWTS